MDLRLAHLLMSVLPATYLVPLLALALPLSLVPLASLVVGVLPLPLLLPIPLVPGVDEVSERVVPSVLWPMLDELFFGPVLSTGLVGPVEPAKAAPEAANIRPVSVRAVNFCLIMI